MVFLYRIEESDCEEQWGKVGFSPAGFSLGDLFQERVQLESVDLKLIP